MPHLRFTKGSPEAISHMKGLRERRKGHKHKPVGVGDSTKRLHCREPEGGCDSTKDAKCKEPEPEPIKEIEQIIKKRRPRIKKEKIQEIIKDAVEKYFETGNN